MGDDDIGPKKIRCDATRIQHDSIYLFAGIGYRFCLIASRGQLWKKSGK
ncbi:hypothetical protein SynBIOSE41_00834 [Synechococcus sp. BIOS-E4-1]|nr:hypothetical protein SynBIOSE41_00834 [Synechococcus sp. BIOS-E4-1]